MRAIRAKLKLAKINYNFELFREDPDLLDLVQRYKLLMIDVRRTLLFGTY